MRNIAHTVLAVWVIIISLSIASCGDDPTPLDKNVTLSFAAKVGNADFSLHTPYISAAGQRYQIEKFEFYLSNIRLVKTDGLEVPLVDVLLYDFSDPTSLSNLQLKVPAGEYETIRMGLGLDSILNNSDPNAFAAGLPLSYSQNTYWQSWDTYIFTTLEGRADADVNGTTFNNSFLYHLGQDELYRDISLARNLTITDTDATTITLHLDFSKIFDQSGSVLNLLQENNTQTIDNFPLAQKITNNFATAWE